MSSPPGPALAEAQTPNIDSDKSARHQRWFEVSLVVFVGFSGILVRAFAQFKAGPGAVAQYDYSRWLQITFHEMGTLLLLGYILKRNGRTFRDIGFRWSGKGAAVGVLLFVASYAVFMVGSVVLFLSYRAIFGAAPPHMDARQLFGHMPWLALPFVLMNPFFEELAVRAYLMTEIRELTGSVWPAALASLVLQTAYHIYYGWLGALSVGIMFFAFTMYFALWRKALPLVVAHGIDDLLGFIRLHW